ncbi:MAG TPA: Crp/Fnr family transcriptional regulator [Acidimicrobiia bacterium]|nr:Crp/Fnr family transcriptional regulator [Acidimicrobiia bacterium]
MRNIVSDGPANPQGEWLAQRVGRPELAPLGPEDVDELAALLQEERYPAGTAIFGVGDAPTRIGIVRSGAVELSCTLNGRRVVVQILRPGDVVGDVALFLRMTSPYEGVALQDTVILTVDSLQFHRLLEERPRLARRWMVSISTRLVSYQSRLLELLAGGLEAQIASVLIRRAERGVVKLSQSNLAELVGGRRTSVNRVLKRLEEQGLVRVRYGQVEVIDEPGLAKVAGL